MQMNII